MGLWGPAGMPRPSVERINAEVNRMLQTPDMRAQMAKLGIEVGGGTPEAFADHVKRDRDTWLKPCRRPA